MEDHLDSTECVTGIMDETNSASDNHEKESAQIDRAVTPRNQHSQSAALLQKNPTEAGSLQEQATSLVEAVGVFNLEFAVIVIVVTILSCLALLAM